MSHYIGCDILWPLINSVCKAQPCCLQSNLCCHLLLESHLYPKTAPPANLQNTSPRGLFCKFAGAPWMPEPEQNASSSKGNICNFKTYNPGCNHSSNMPRGYIYSPIVCLWKIRPIANTGNVGPQGICLQHARGKGPAQGTQNRKGHKAMLMQNPQPPVCSSNARTQDSKTVTCNCKKISKDGMNIKCKCKHTV